MKSLTLFSQDGRVVSCHKLKGHLHDCVYEDENTYIIEMRKVSVNDFLTDEAAERAEFIVWRLDEAQHT